MYNDVFLEINSIVLRLLMPRNNNLDIFLSLPSYLILKPHLLLA